MDNQEQLYKQGFNNGYIMATHNPSLLHKIIQDLRPTGYYLEGLFSGKEEYSREHLPEQLKNLKDLRNNGQYFERNH